MKRLILTSAGLNQPKNKPHKQARRVCSVGLLLCLFYAKKRPFWLHLVFTLLFTLGVTALLCCSKKCAKLEISRIFTLRETHCFTTICVFTVQIWCISANFTTEIKEKSTETIRCFNGGGDGSRTRVREGLAIAFSGRSLSIEFPSSGRRQAAFRTW